MLIGVRGILLIGVRGILLIGVRGILLTAAMYFHKTGTGIA
jgi:hypothetical protein